MHILKRLVNLSLFLLLYALACAGQTSVLMPLPIAQFFSANGTPLANGSLGFYASGTFNAQGVFSDATGATALSNPVPLNAGGYPQNGSGSITGIWLSPGVAYRVQAKDSNGVQQWLVDGVIGNASSQAFLSTAVSFSTTATFSACAQTQLFTMTLTGNVTSSNFNECPEIGIPAIVIFEIAQDGAGARTFAWPANSFGGGGINPNPNGITVQTFLWDGLTLFAISPALGNDQVLRFPAISTNGINIGVTSNPLLGSHAPVVQSGFGTGASVTANNGGATFRVNVGTGGTANSGVINMGSATTGWNCQATDITNPGANYTKESASTTLTVTFTNYNSTGTPTAWTASDVLAVNCLAF